MAGARLAVVAVQPFDYCGESVQTGDVCLVRPVDAAALIYRSRARWVREQEALGVYCRRDLVAQPIAVTSPRRRRRTSTP